MPPAPSPLPPPFSAGRQRGRPTSHGTEHWLLQMGCTASYRLSNDHTWVCPKGAGHHRLVLKLRRDKTTHPEKSHWIYHQ
uniref:Uncharacterized protein n=1 Tax=Oryza rufipogon TaxID=4529 RepID=A0A0E0NRK8_ORYRU